MEVIGGMVSLGVSTEALMNDRTGMKWEKPALLTVMLRLKVRILRVSLLSIGNMFTNKSIEAAFERLEGPVAQKA